MKTNIKLLVAFVAMAMVACQEPYEVPPTTTSIGIHSVTATFLKGPLSTNALAKFTTDVTSLEEDIVIPIPYYFPETSNDQITDITQMRVEASMDYNCFLEPGLVVLDLTKRNEFLYTDGRGEQHNIVIRGEIRKLSHKEIVSLSVKVEGSQLITILDKENKVINISYTDATEPLIGACTVKYDLSPHATCSLDGLESVDLTTLKEIVVTAHDGTTQTYTVVSQNNTPKKVPYGYAAGSEEELWCLEMEGIGIPCVETNNQSLAVLDDYLVVCPGNGDAPLLLNKTTGKVEKTMTLSGGVEAGYVCNDDAGNLLICNNTDATFCIWRTSDIDATPELLLSYDNTTGYPLGGAIKMQGDVDGNALIVAPFWGVEGVGGQNNIIYWHITEGVVSEPAIQAITGFVGPVKWGAYYWWFPSNAPLAFTPLGTRIEDGLLLSVYDENILYLVDGTTFTCSQLLGAYTTLGENPPINRSISAKHFNNARYVALYTAGAWPDWAVFSHIYLYDMTTLAGMSGSLDDTAALKIHVEPDSFFKQGGGTGGGVAPTGDVILVPSTDGYYMHLYCIDNNNRWIVAYQVDCIDDTVEEEEGAEGEGSEGAESGTEGE
ncbi:MAG: DUF5018 domain-containing protein [Tidjanibacter sp.]|nr:DUF5018 domain-containing protein [Tidjanibacter sp.]